MPPAPAWGYDLTWDPAPRGVSHCWSCLLLPRERRRHPHQGNGTGSEETLRRFTAPQPHEPHGSPKSPRWCRSAPCQHQHLPHSSSSPIGDGAGQDPQLPRSHLSPPATGTAPRCSAAASLGKGHLGPAGCTVPSLGVVVTRGWRCQAPSLQAQPRSCSPVGPRSRHHPRHQQGAWVLEDGVKYQPVPIGAGQGQNHSPDLIQCWLELLPAPFPLLLGPEDRQQESFASPHPELRTRRSPR